MSEQKPCLLDEQKKSKPKIEDVIPEYLDGDAKRIALDLVAYMRENKMTLRWGGITNTWKSMYKGNCICRMDLCMGRSWEKNKKWVITPYLSYLHEYENLILNEKYQNIIWDGMTYCNGCPPNKGGSRVKNRPCIGGFNATILGKECKGVCANVRLTRVSDPDEATLDGVKKLLEFEKKAREASAETKRK